MLQRHAIHRKYRCLKLNKKSNNQQNTDTSVVAGIRELLAIQRHQLHVLLGARADTVTQPVGRPPPSSLVGLYSGNERSVNANAQNQAVQSVRRYTGLFPMIHR